MTGNLPPLDGRWIDWSLYSSNRLPSIILWVSVSSVVAGLYKFIGKQKLLKMVTYLSTGLSLMLMVTLITLCVMNNGLEKANSFFCTTKNEFQLSKKIFIVLILDAVDATYFQEQLNENEIKKDIFADFTFYNNVLGAYPHTKDSIPMILSGIWYENQMEYEDYLKEVYEKSPLLTALKDDNYTMGLYEDDSFLVNNCMEQFDNMQKAHME